MNAHVQHDSLLPWADTAFRENPYPWYDVLRREAPVYRDPIAENTYIVSRYDDVVKFGKHPSLSMIAPSWVPKGPWSLFKDSMIVSDPPDHTAHRRRSNKWFTPKLANQWAQATAKAVNEAIDDLGPGGMIEAFRNLALIPAHHAMCAALGLPNDGYDTGSAWMHDAMTALGSAVTEEEEQRCQAAFDYLSDRVRHYLQMRRANPQPGVVSSWIEDVANGEMNEQQLFEGLLLFWATGTPNAAYLITGGLEIFARRPDVFELWKSDPGKHQAIFSEIARLHTPEISFTRFTTEELEIRGVKIPVGMMVRFMIASANRDPEVFTNPHEVDVTRSTEMNQHISFGVGAHSCPGMIISTAEANAVFNTVAQRVKRVELAGRPVYNHNDRSAAYSRLPLRLVI
ncbi:cytochrome P450 [Rhizobium sp. YTU87027]|uniref:cytochrome P450 n=1 Tax=Rhizobium sp. YTU87027 TaxID=3417741 RepID=UPI003D69DD50